MGYMGHFLYQEKDPDNGASNELTQPPAVKSPRLVFDVNTINKGDDNEGALNTAAVNRNNALSDVIDVKAGGNFTIALKRDGSVYVWGDNRNGERGDNTTTTYSNSRVLKQSRITTSEVSSGYYNTRTAYEQGDTR
jgi:hypothetical protein